MPLYFLALDAGRYQRDLAPPLGASWRARSFEPARALAAALVPAARDYAARFHTGRDEPLLARVAEGLPFDRGAWRLLVGEALLYAAERIPEFTTAPDTLALLVPPHAASGPDTPRGQLAPMEQAHRGSRDLVLGGGIYRSDAAGLNDADDVVRLAGYLDTVDPRAWGVELLAERADLDAEGREEEVAYARDIFEPLREFYRRARDEGWVVVCEFL